MLPKRLRLPVQEAFARRGRALQSKEFTLRVLPAERGYSRFGIAVGQRAAERAVDRNRLRRIFFNLAQTLVPALPCRDYLAVAAPGAGKLSKEEIVRKLTNLFRNILNY